MSAFLKKNKPADKFLWLEDIKSQKAKRWVKAQNRRSLRELAQGETFNQFEAEALKILEAKDKIPYVQIRGKWLYNFWRDSRHPRGRIRRTSYSSYKTKKPKWETVLDIDRLAKKEKKNWTHKRTNCLPPEHRRCLIYLSLGGGDKTAVREFDMKEKSFVKGGFALPAARTSAGWLDENHIAFSTNFGPGSLTNSKYPRVVKLWRRGEDLSQAKKIYSARPEDMGAWLYRFSHQKDWLLFISRDMSFFKSDLFVFQPQNKTLKKFPIPPSARALAYLNGFFIVKLRDPLAVGGKKYKAGDIIAISKRAVGEKLKAGHIQLIFSPKPHQAFRKSLVLKNKLILSVLENVRGKVFWTELKGDKWRALSLLDLPSRGEIYLSASTDQKDLFFYTTSFANQPASLFSYEFGKGAAQLKALPHRFKAKDIAVAQKFAASKDGTKVPYFLIHKKGMKYNGESPALLYGYGGFSSSMLPRYNPVLGKLFLERGGVYALANIRGGGEYGPKWHISAMKENRQRAFDDFISVAEDLIQSRVTSPKRLAIEGASNGGLLVGAVMAQRPELFSAVICAVPLLDMLRYTKLFVGASWIEEYGDPEIPKYRKALLKYSPYHNIFKNKKYPKMFIYSSFLDDRVHPGHGRKMTAKAQKQGHDVLYYENLEGGHSASANLRQEAKLSAMKYNFLRQTVFPKN